MGREVEEEVAVPEVVAVPVVLAAPVLGYERRESGSSALHVFIFLLGT